MVLAGNDETQPFEYAETLAGILPDAILIPERKTGKDLEAAKRRIKDFLRSHTPQSS